MKANTIINTQDGSHSIFSEEFGVSYHSKYGAITESRHVFIDAGLYPKIIAQEKTSVLEIGFGTGLNAFITFLEATLRKVAVSYVGIEAYPISEPQLNQLNYPTLLHAVDQKDIFLQMHLSSWDQPQKFSEYFTFKKQRMLFEEIAFKNIFDVIYFDAFAPNAQPHLWEIPLLQKMYEALKPEGIFVTYCAKGAVKRNLKALGFKVEALPGPPGKREMTRGIKI